MHYFPSGACTPYLKYFHYSCDLTENSELDSPLWRKQRGTQNLLWRFVMSSLLSTWKLTSFDCTTPYHHWIILPLLLKSLPRTSAYNALLYSKIYLQIYSPGTNSRLITVVLSYSALPFHCLQHIAEFMTILVLVLMKTIFTS